MTSVQPTNELFQMTVTLTDSYKTFCAPATVEKIEELLEDNYELEAMLQFIDEYNERAFVEIYEEYVRCGEAIGYEAVDALASEDGIDNIADCDDRYRGEYDSEADFAESWTYEMHGDVPSYVVVDWEATWECNLRYDFTFASGYVFSDH